MANQALGLIETRGLVGALEASDAAAKAADVVIVEIEIPSAGVCTVKLVGEVADVSAAVEAGREAASRVSEVIAHHVIPRPDSEIEKLLKTEKIVLSETSGSINALIRPEEKKTKKK